MNQNNVLSLLTQFLGPLKMQPQPTDANFGKFQDLLMQGLTQPTLEFEKSGVELLGLHTSRIPEDIEEELEKLAEKIMVAKSDRKPTDPVYWLRQRDVPVVAGIEESIENFLEPFISFDVAGRNGKRREAI